MCSCCGNRAFTFDAYGDTMFRYVVVRLWLADRPGSLGQIATRIGELGGDLVGIDILERDGARAVDEFTVELPDGYSPEALANALSELSGVEVEDLRHRVSEVPYAGRDPLDAAVLLAEARGPTELSSVLARGVCTAFTCDWCTVLDVSDARAVVLAEEGDAPSAAWLGVFAAGARAGLSLSPGGGAGLVGPRTLPGRRWTHRVSWSWQVVTDRLSGAANDANSNSCAGSPTPGGASWCAPVPERRYQARGSHATNALPPRRRSVPTLPGGHKADVETSTSATGPGRAPRRRSPVMGKVRQPGVG